MALKLSFSKHAREKVKERKITEKTLKIVLEKPRARFYDMVARAEVAVGEISQQGLSFNIVVIFRKNGDVYHIVTAYPVRIVEGEVER